LSELVLSHRCYDPMVKMKNFDTEVRLVALAVAAVLVAVVATVAGT